MGQWADRLMSCCVAVLMGKLYRGFDELGRFDDSEGGWVDESAGS